MLKRDTLERRPEISGKFSNVVLEKDGEDLLDRSCEKLSITYSQKEMNILHKQKRNANWVGHNLRKELLSKTCY